MSEENKAMVRRLYEAVNSGDMSALEASIAESFVDHEEVPGFPPTKEGTIQFFGALREAFPDLRMSVEDVLAEGDKVSVRAMMSGTHEREFAGMPATGKKINVPLIDHLRLENGKVVEHWGVMDSGAMMQQLGG